jgi:hypothetical protein
VASLSTLTRWLVFASWCAATGPYAKQNTFPSTSSQQTFIVSYPDGNGQPAFIYIGDRWQSAPDGIKGHDFTVFAPLSFDASGNVTSPGFLESFNITVA